jgi:phosphomannomutase
MITASHNTWEDNGVKIIEPDGSMLVPRWEQMAEHIVNADDITRCIKSVSESTVKQWTLGVDIFSNEPI